MTHPCRCEGVQVTLLLWLENLFQYKGHHMQVYTVFYSQVYIVKSFTICFNNKMSFWYFF